MSRAWSPNLTTRLLGVALALFALLLFLSSPALLAELRGDPMLPGTIDRFNFLRLSVGALATGAAAWCFVRTQNRGCQPLLQLVAAVPYAALLVVVLYKMLFGVRDGFYLRFIREDGPVEYLTAVVFLAGGMVAAVAAYRARDWQTQTAVALLAFALLFAGFSEISFGQRLLGLETPEALREINRQQEISIHNIYGIESFVYGVVPFLLLGYALFSRSAARGLAHTAAGRYLSPDLLAVVIVPWFAVGYFLPMAIFSFKRAMVHDHVWQDQEPGELFIAFGLLFVALNAWYVLSRPSVCAADLQVRQPVVG